MLHIELEDATPLVLRPLAPGDERLIFNSWLQSYRKGGRGMMDVPSQVYFSQHHRLIEKALRRSSVLVAANAEDLTQILGYLVSEEVSGLVVVHYVYVKAPFRNAGIGRALMEAATGDAQSVHHSHATPAGSQLVKRFKSVFNPYLAH